MFEISDTPYRLLMEKFEFVFTEIDVMVGNLTEDDEKGKSQLLKLKDKFDRYLTEMPVVGFNSSRYDINVIRRFLFKQLEAAE